MSKKIFLHIGTEKTGSSAIQACLAQNRTTLLNRGYFYPDIFGDGPHIAFTTSFKKWTLNSPLHKAFSLATLEQAKQFREETLRSFSMAMNQLSVSSVIISDEHISGFLTEEDELRDMKTFLESINLSVCPVIYLRNIHSYLLAIISEMIKNLAVNGFDINNPVLTMGSLDPRFNYARLLDCVESLSDVGDPVVIKYQEVPQFNSLEPFLETCGLKLSDLEPATTTLRANRSIPYQWASSLAAIGAYSLNNNIKTITDNWRYIIDKALTLLPRQQKTNLDNANMEALKKLSDPINAKVLIQRPDLKELFELPNSNNDTDYADASDSNWRILKEVLLECVDNQASAALSDVFIALDDPDKRTKTAFLERTLLAWEANRKITADLCE